jgi:transposase
MPVYRFPSGSASCAVPGCGCRSRSRCYPSDMSDTEWEVLRPEAEAVMAELRKGPGGAAMKHDLRAMLDAIGYLTRYGIEWRAMPVDFPPWPAVYAFFERWSARAMPQRLVDR